MTLFANLSRAQMDHVAVRRRRAVSTLEESMQLFAAWTAEEEQPMQEEAVPAPEPEAHRPMAALLSTKSDEQLAVVPAAPAARHANSCPDLVASSLGSLLALLIKLKPAQVETLQNSRLALPAQVPKWMLAAREMDPPNSLVSTVSLPSNWDAQLTARLSSSSIFNLFSDPVPASPAPSLFAINPAGVSSDASTVSVPTSFWDTPSTVSIGPSGFFGVRPATSRTSSIRVEMSSDTSSASSLFPDPRSAASSATGLCEDCALALALNAIWNGEVVDETAASESCDCKAPATELSSTTSLHRSSTSKDSLLAGALHRLWNGLPVPEDANTPRTPITSTCVTDYDVLKEEEEEEEEESSATTESQVSAACSCLECREEALAAPEDPWNPDCSCLECREEAPAAPEDQWHYAPECTECQTVEVSDADVEADDFTSSSSVWVALDDDCDLLCSECALAEDAAVDEDADHVSTATSSGYETDVDSFEEPVVVLQTSATTQSEAESKAAAARMIAECDEMLVRVAEMRRKLMEMM